METDGRIQRGEATRARLIDAARRRFGADGYEATSIEAILHDSGVAKGALYHHFASKEALFDAVLDSVIADVAQQAERAAMATTDPVSALRDGCDQWLVMAMDPAIQRIVLLDAPAVVGWQRWRELDELHLLGGLRHALNHISETGRVPADQIDVLANMLLAAVNEAAMVVVGADDPPAALARGRAALHTLLDRLIGEPA